MSISGLPTNLDATYSDDPSDASVKEHQQYHDTLHAAARGVETVATGATSYTLVLTDAGKVVETTSASAVTLTVPPNSSVAFPVGTVIEVCQYGAGQVTLTPGAGVTLRSRGSALKTAGQYGSAFLRKRGTNEWMVTGDVST